MNTEKPTAIEIWQDEDYWKLIKKEFAPSSDFINLENGFYSPQPIVVKEAYKKNIDYVNSLTSFYMRNHWDEDKLKMKKLAGDNLGCHANEFFFTRNTTESLNTVIMGLPLKSGDEILITDQDYPSALVQWKYRARRDHLKLKILDIKGLSDEQIAELFEKNISRNSKVLHTTHMIHATGQILPVRKLADIAHSKGVEVIVDGAHSVNHIEYKIPDLDADYFTCSLHKWTCNPLGSGVLFIKPDKLGKLSPLFGEVSFHENDIRKMERLGTLEPPVFLTLPTALEFHYKIGAAIKERRLHFLKNYWAERITEIPGVQIQTPLEKGKSGAIGNFFITGKNNAEVSKTLFDKYKIFTSTIDDFPIQGIRVTAHLHTIKDELDKFIDAVKEIAKV